MKKLLLLFIILLKTNSFAQDSGDTVRVNLGAFYSQNRAYRGALVWDAPIMAVGPSFTFYNTFTIGEGGLSAFKILNENNTVAVGLSSFGDDKPGFPIIKLEDKKEDFKNKRATTYETYIKYDFRSKQSIKFSATYHKDLKRHKGNYIETKISFPLIPFVSIGVAADLGDKAANQYAYGPEAVSGIGSTEQFIGAFLPFLPWQGRLILNLSQSNISKSKNSNADYVRGNKKNTNFTSIMAWSF